MRGRGSSRGRPGYRGRGVSADVPRFSAPPQGSGHGKPPRSFRRASPSPPKPHYGGSPTGFPQTPMENAPPFRLPSSHRGRGGPGRGSGGFGKHQSSALHRMYGLEGMLPPPFMGGGSLKPIPQGGRGSSRSVAPFEMPHMPNPGNMQKLKQMVQGGIVPPMMIGQFLPMFSLAPDKIRQDNSGGPPVGPQSHATTTTPRFRRERRTSSPPRWDSGYATSDDGPRRRLVSLETLVDTTRVTGAAEAMEHSFRQLKNALSRIKIAIPSIFRIRNNYKLRSDEERMITVVEDVYRYLLVAHLQKAHKMHPPLDLQKGGTETLKFKEPLIKFVGSKENVAVIDATEIQTVLETQPLHYNKMWFVVRWGNSVDENKSTLHVNGTPHFVKTFSTKAGVPQERVNSAVLLRAITVEMFEEHMDVVKLLCKTGSASKEALLQCMGYYALCCDDDPFITLASSILPALEMNTQVEFYVVVAQLLDSSRYSIGNVYMERYFERILPMCLALPDSKAWAPTIKLLMKTIEPLRLGVKSSTTAISLLRTLKSWCNVFIRCEETCVEVFNKCIQLVLQAGDDSRIVVRGAAADLAVQIWLNSHGKAAVLKRIGYDTVRTLGCISGVQAIKFNIWSDLLSNEEPNSGRSGYAAARPDLLLCRMDHYDTVLQYLHHEESKFITSMLRADPDLLRYLMNWYLLRYCKITKTLLALEKIASVIRFALMTYPRISKELPQHASSNIAILCCWMLNIATGCSVGSGCLELANVKMALFVDWLFFNYKYNSHIIRLCMGPDATTKCDYVMQRIGVHRRLFVKELAKCIYIMRRPDIVDDEEHGRKMKVLLGANEVMNFSYNTAIETFRRLLDYLLNAVLHYHSEVAVVAVDVISAIFIVSMLDINKSSYTLSTLLGALKNTMLGKMCSVVDISLDSMSVTIGHVDDPQVKQTLQPRTPLTPIQDKYTVVVSIAEKHKNTCYDDTLKSILTQCYGMILEYVINVESLNAMYHANHLTADTLRANYELERMEHMLCPKLYPNLDIVNTDQETDWNDSDSLPSDDVGATQETVVADTDALSDISSDDNTTSDNIGKQLAFAPRFGKRGVTADIIGDLKKNVFKTSQKDQMKPPKQAKIILDLPPFAAKQLIQNFVQGSMNNVAMNFAEEPLYRYIRDCLDVDGTPDYMVVLNPSEESPSAFKLVPQHGQEASSDRMYRVASVLDIVISYLLETALHCLHDDVNGTSNVDNILFRDWIVHIFNAFVRLLSSLFIGGHVAIAWELMYYIAATSVIVSSDTNEGSMISEGCRTVQKKKLIAIALYFNMAEVVAEKRNVKQNWILHRTVTYVLKKSVGCIGSNLQLILESLIPIRFALETVLKNEFEHFGKLSSLMGVILKLTPVSGIATLIEEYYATKLNIFSKDVMNEAELGSYVRTLLSQGAADAPLHLRHNIIAWQMLCRIYEFAFGTNRMRQTLKHGRPFLTIKSEPAVVRNLAWRPYITDVDIGHSTSEVGNVICLLGTSNNSRSNFMVYQKGYTFTDDLFSNHQMHILSSAMVEALKTENAALMQIAMFSAFPIFVHSVPTEDVMHDITQCLSLVMPRKGNNNVQIQFISEMLLVLLVHWLTRYPQLLITFEHGIHRLGEALDHLAVKYASGRMMQFNFNGTTIQVQLENVLLLKLAV